MQAKQKVSHDGFLHAVPSLLYPLEASHCSQHPRSTYQTSSSKEEAAFAMGGQSRGEEECRRRHSKVTRLFRRNHGIEEESCKRMMACRVSDA